jgi:hypothetical protein
MADVPQQSMARATVTHAPGSVDMGAYPFLVYNWRERQVKVASNGTPVADILDFRDTHADLPAGGLGRLFGISDDEMTEIERWELDPSAPGRA